MSMVATGAAAVVINQSPLNDQVQPVSLASGLDQLLWTAGLGIDQVEISGHRLSSDRDILDAVWLEKFGSFVSFDGSAVRRRIELMPWVAAAAIERRLPNTVVITITERQAFAIWQRATGDVIVDRTGRTLSPIARATTSDLPRITGLDAATDAARLLDLITPYPELAQRLQTAERVAGRRWRLQLVTKGQPTLVVELPPETEAAALAVLMEVGPHGRLVDADTQLIDLRVLRRVTIGRLNTALRSSEKSAERAGERK